MAGGAASSDRIAICGEFRPSSLKHRLLFFDRIGVAELETIVRALHEREDDLANDLEFLREQNIAFEVKQYRDLPDEELSKEVLADIRHIKLTNEFWRGVRSAPERWQSLLAPESASLEVLRHVFFSARQAWARLVALSMQLDGVTASAVISDSLTIPAGLENLYKSPRPSAKVIDVILNKLPMPSEETPWEAILDFKADTEAQGYLQGLKVWMADLARQKLTANEASEKLDWLLFQHKKHLEMHKLSYRWGTLGGTFVAAAEILEDLAKIKWGKAAGAVVSIFDKRVELMKAELSNPAKEVSYIVKAQEQFAE